jgi:site-specific recombinase XerD
MEKITLIKVAKKDTEALTESEIVKVRDVAHKENKRIYLALTDFLLSTGIRVGELCNLNKSDVNFETREVKVYSTKTNSYRTVYINDNALIHLKDYLNKRKDKNNALFVNKYGNNRISRDVCENILHDIEHKANLNKSLTVHMFRRTFATKLCERGMDITYVSDLLGHSRIDTSRKYYIKRDKRNQKNSFMNCLN